MGRKNNGNTGKWNKTQHQKFMKALVKYGKNWSMIQKCVQTRSLVQVRSHAQKLFLSMNQEQLHRFQQQLDRRFEMFCNSEKNKRQKKEQGVKIQSPTPQTDNLVSSDQKVQSNQKIQDNLEPPQKTSSQNPPNQITVSSPFLAPPYPFLTPTDLLTAQILLTQNKIQALLFQLNENARLSLPLSPNTAPRNTPIINQMNLSLLSYLNANPY